MRFGALTARGIAVLAVLVLAIGGGVYLLFLRGSSDKPVVEAGSRFGDGTSATKGGTLLDALAPVLSANQPDRPQGSDPAAPTAAELGQSPGDAVAGLFIVGFAGKTPASDFFERLGARPYGGVLLTRSNYTEPSQLATLTRAVQSTARRASAAAPLVVAQQEGGTYSAFANLAPEPQVDIGELNTRKVFSSALAAGKQLGALGVTLTLAPYADLAVAGGPGQGRAFSDDPVSVSRAVRASVGAYKSAGVVAAVGPFPGDGAASQDPSNGPAPVGLSLPQLRAADLKPFQAVATGSSAAAAIQMSNAIYVAYDGVTPATLLPAAYQELRGRMGFKGAIISADLTATTATSGGTVGEAAVLALKAGADMLLVPGGRAQQDEAYREVVAAVRRREIAPERIVSALQRIATLRRLSRGARNAVKIPSG